MEINPCTILVRREAMLGPIGLVDEDIPGGYCEDYYLLDKHPELGRNPAGRARIEGQIAFAHAALGGAARQWAAHGLSGPTGGTRGATRPSR